MHRVLPPDIITEILIRTDIEFLARSKWVCKEWRRLVSHPQFINRHYQKSKNICGYIADNTPVDKHEARSSYKIEFFPHPSPPLSDSLPSLTFMREPVKIHASTPHGLLLCFGLFRERYYVCKPTTREWSTIPIPDKDKYTLKLAMSVASSSPLRFRIMRMVNYHKNLKIDCEIFDSDSCGEWRTIKGVGPLLGCNKWCLAALRQGVVVNGSFVWLPRKGEFGVTKIVCVDLWAEKVKMLELPVEMVTDVEWINRLSNFDGGLGLVRLRSSCWDLTFEFWSRTSTVKGGWEKIHVLDLNNDVSLHGFNFEWMRNDYIVDNTVLTKPDKCRNNILWYNLKEGRYIKTNVFGMYNASQFYFFRSDYFPCNIDDCPYNKFGGS